MEGGLLLKIMAFIGGGAKAISYFQFGPEYLYPGNCYSERPYLADIFTSLNKAHGLIGKAEELLWPGTRPPAQIAILQPRSSFVWDPITLAGQVQIWENMTQNTAAYQSELYGLFLALSVHANYPIDFIDEDSLSDGTLANTKYKLLILTEPNIPSEGLTAVARWMRAGGTTMTVNGAATADRYDEPTSILSEATGIEQQPGPRLLIDYSTDCALQPEAEQCTAGPPQWPEVVTGVAKWGDATGAFAAVGVRGHSTANLTNKSSPVTLATFSDGSVAAQLIRVGDGQALHFDFLPGLSYMPNATNWQRLPTPAEFSTPLRKLLAEAARVAGVQPLVNCSDDFVETPVLQSQGGLAVTLLNWGHKKFTVANPLALRIRPLTFRPVSVVSADLGPLSFSALPGDDGVSFEVTVNVSLDLADVLMLHQARLKTNEGRQDWRRTPQDLDLLKAELKSELLAELRAKMDDEQALSTYIDDDRRIRSRDSDSRRRRDSDITFNIYVSALPDDNAEAIAMADGSIEQPFRTVFAARDAVRLGLGKGRPRTVWVEGDHHLPEPLVLDERDSGTTDNPVIWRSHSLTAKARLTGGRKLPAHAFKPAIVPSGASGVVKAELFSLGLNATQVPGFAPLDKRGFPMGKLELFVDGQPMERARSPNIAADGTWLWAGYENMSDIFSGGMAFAFEDSEKAQLWAPAAAKGELWLHGYFEYDWRDTYIKIDSISKVGGGRGQCSLKDCSGGCPPPVFDKVCTSGVKSSKTYPGWGQASRIRNQTNFKAHNLDTVSKMSSPLLCQSECDSNASCTEWTYTPNLQPSAYKVTRDASTPLCNDCQFTIGRRFYAVGALELLDAPDEYHVDHKTGTLYFLPTVPLSPSTDIVVSVLDTVIVAGANHTHFQDMIFSVARKGPVFTTVGPSATAQFVIVENSTVSNSGGSCLELHGRNNMVAKCTVFGCGAQGIDVAAGNMTTLEAGHSQIIGNNITKCSRIQRTYTPGIKFVGVGNHFASNTITDFVSQSMCLCTFLTVHIPAS
jgi:hypothetical protein